MKNLSGLLLGLALAMALPITLSAQKIKIGLSLPTQHEARWGRDRAIMENYAKRLGSVELSVQVADGDISHQASQVAKLISQGIQVLILTPADAETAAGLVSVAKSYGIRVVAYDRMIMNSPDLALFVSFDDYKVGCQQAQYLVDQPIRGNIIILSGPLGDETAQLFKNGAMSVLGPLIDGSKLRVISDAAVENWLPARAQDLVEQALGAYSNQITAILAPNDALAGGAIQALSAHGLAGKVLITGQGAELAALKRIIAGTQSMTIFKDSRVSAKAAIDAAIAVVKGGDTLKKLVNNQVYNGAIDVPACLVASTVIDKTNLKLLSDSGYLKAGDLK